MSGIPEYIDDIFRDFGEVRCRKMFGGHGVFHNGLMFALIADDMLYLKATPETAQVFLERGLDQFSYPKGDKLVKISYFQAPEEIYDDPGEAALWAERAYGAALRAKAGNARK